MKTYIAEITLSNNVKPADWKLPKWMFNRSFVAEISGAEIAPLHSSNDRPNYEMGDIRSIALKMRGDKSDYEEVYAETNTPDFPQGITQEDVSEIQSRFHGIEVRIY